jgi:hypothetical protein
MDPLRHPDLVSLSRTVRHRFDKTLRAEQEAAQRARLRATTLRDHLVDADDREQPVTLAVEGAIHTGVIVAVGVDHVTIEVEGRERMVSLHRVAWMETHPGTAAGPQH